MNTEHTTLNVAGLTVSVVRKDIKNLHLAVYPPDGAVRVAAPLGFDNDAVRVAVIDKLPWIRDKQHNFNQQPRQPRRELVSGETHYYLGQPYRLRVTETTKTQHIDQTRNGYLTLHARPEADRDQRNNILNTWYRTELRSRIAPLINTWTQQLNIEPPTWQIRRMKTRWGTCNPKRRSILFNLELAKKPTQCIEYLVVHELIHLIEHRHTDRFTQLMDEHLPTWRQAKRMLNDQPLAHETWTY